MNPGMIELKLWNNVPWMERFRATKEGSPTSLVGCSLFLQMRVLAGEEEVAISLSTDEGTLKIEPDAASGWWRLNVDISRALQVAAGNYVHDLVVVPADGVPFLGHVGPATINDGVTRNYTWKGINAAT